jgi:hypothetical protein
MSDSILFAPYFHDEEAAYTFVEARIWPRRHCVSDRPTLYRSFYYV